MTLLVFGKTGQVARVLREASEVVALGRDDVDLTRPESAYDAVMHHRPAAVINAAAYTAVDKAEEDANTAHLVNARAPGAMARAAAELKIPLVHISTDYVFDGAGDQPIHTGAPTGPLNVYGATKLAGEKAVEAAGGPHAILRTSWVFSPEGPGFLQTMLRLGAERRTLTVVADQVGGPTPASAIAETCLQMANTLTKRPELTGVYHYAGAPDVSWAGFARQIFATAALDCSVQDIPTRDYPTPAQRPLNSRLDCSTTETAFGIARPDWRRALADILKTTGAQAS